MQNQNFFIFDKRLNEISTIAFYLFDSEISIFRNIERKKDILVFNKDENDTKDITYLIYLDSDKLFEEIKKLSMIRKQIKVDMLFKNFRI